tara:strand:+ start:72 stop:194 length:123 start_codon:yes stop_codon:yes gene_type:complete
MKNDNEKTAEALWIVLMLLAGMTGLAFIGAVVLTIIKLIG